MTELPHRSTHPLYARARVMKVFLNALKAEHEAPTMSPTRAIAALGTELAAADPDRLAELAVLRAARLIAIAQAAVTCHGETPVDQEAWENQVVASIVENLGGAP